METKPEKQDKPGRARPIKNEIELIGDSPQNIARPMFRGADKKIKRPTTN